MEIQPTIYSSLLPSQELLPFNDPKAMQIASGIFHARPDSLPASANDLASIGSTIIKFLPTAVSWLSDLFKNRNSAPKQHPKQTPKPTAQKKIVNRKMPQKRTNRNNSAAAKDEPAATLPTYVNKPVKYEGAHGVPLQKYMAKMQVRTKPKNKQQLPPAQQ